MDFLRAVHRRKGDDLAAPSRGLLPGHLDEHDHALPGRVHERAFTHAEIHGEMLRAAVAELGAVTLQHGKTHRVAIGQTVGILVVVIGIRWSEHEIVPPRVFGIGRRPRQR